MASLKTTDVCDSNAELLENGDLRCLQPIFQIYGKRRAFSGPIVTLRVFENNKLLIELLKTRGKGRVIVMDGGGSTKCALMGGILGRLAQDMGWAGVVINGYIRDVDDINGYDIGVRALATLPRRPKKEGFGEKHVSVHVAGTLIHDGEWLYADSDGILVSKTELSASDESSADLMRLLQSCED